MPAEIELHTGPPDEFSGILSDVCAALADNADPIRPKIAQGRGFMP